MKILLFGAGAVGQVYARHLQMGGAEVSFFVREKYAAEARAGFTMYCWNQKNALANPIRFEGFGVLTTLDEVRATTWDQVYLCVSSTAIRAGWLEDFIGAVGDAIVVSLQPGMYDRDYIHQYVEPQRLVMGTIGFQSYHAPMPGETVKDPGIAYWSPSFSPTPFSGPSKANLEAVLAPLRRGKLGVAIQRDVVHTSAYISTMLILLIVCLECNDWSFKKLAKSGELKALRRAVLEMFRVFKLDLRPPFPLWVVSLFLRPGMLRLGLAIAPRIAPFDIELFLNVHFSKVGDQTTMYLDDYIERGKKKGVATPTVELLTRKLTEIRSAKLS